MNQALRALPVLAVATAFACGGATSDPRERYNGRDYLLSDEITEDGLVIRRVDIDLDGEADTFEYFRAEDALGQPVTEYEDLLYERYDDLVIVRKEMDVNLDGALDLRREYGPGAQLLREEFDVDFDGTFDTTNFYEEGVLSQRSNDTDGDGVAESIIYFREGAIHRIETDVTGEGETDEWEYFENDRLVRVGIDLNGDGVIDQRMRSEEQGDGGPRPETRRHNVRDIRPISRPEDALGTPEEAAARNAADGTTTEDAAGTDAPTVDEAPAVDEAPTDAPDDATPDDGASTDDVPDTSTDDAADETADDESAAE